MIIKKITRKVSSDFTVSFSIVSSVGNAPCPTLVVYAFTAPYTGPILVAGTPRPVQTPPMLQLDEVTMGYEPEKSITCFGTPI